jgi:hypothetical protein
MVFNHKISDKNYKKYHFLKHLIKRPNKSIKLKPILIFHHQLLNLNLLIHLKEINLLILGKFYKINPQN